MAHKISDKEVRRLARAAEQQGWVVERTNGGHYRFVGPCGQLRFVSGTPSDHRTVANFRAELRRAGLDI